MLNQNQYVIADQKKHTDDVVASCASFSSKETLLLSAEELVGRVYCLDQSTQEIKIVHPKTKNTHQTSKQSVRQIAKSTPPHDYQQPTRNENGADVYEKNSIIVKHGFCGTHANGGQPFTT